MGISLGCFVNFKGMSTQKWEKIYLEILDWFDKCPLPLIRYDIIQGKDGNFKRVYTKDIVCDKGSEDECWNIVGDEASYGFGECFHMYRNLGTVLRGRGENGLSEHSVFYADGDDIALEDSIYGINVWGKDKGLTKGEPIHLVLLMAGIWMECRLPGACFIQGDLNKPLAERVLSWMQGHSNEPLEIPIVLDEKRLWDHTEGLFGDCQLAMRRFFALFKGDKIDAYTFFLESGYKREIMKMLAKDLADFTSLGGLGAITIIRNFLRATEDVELLIELVDMANEVKLKENAGEGKEKENSPFKMKDLLKELCMDLVMVNPVKKESIMALDSFPVDNGFLSIYMMLSGLRKYDPKIYVAKEDLFEAFMYRMPKKARSFKKIIDKTVANHGKLIKKYNKQMNGLASKREAAIEESGMEEDVEEAGDTLFMQMAWLKKQKYKDEEIAFRGLGKYLRNVFPNFAPSISRNPDRLKMQIFTIAFKIGLVFHDDAVAELERLENIKLLSLLCILVCHNEGFSGASNEFILWFDHFFRHPKFWPLLLGED